MRIIENGLLKVFGRSDRIFISSGENVNPHEIETKIEAFPGIHQCTRRNYQQFSVWNLSSSMIRIAERFCPEFCLFFALLKSSFEQTLLFVVRTRRILPKQVNIMAICTFFFALNFDKQQGFDAENQQTLYSFWNTCSN